ncbi:hypothetical protein PQR14_33965 [Paraburkholderia bryophila]|uniref:hypothetical protein n=1 Tax=Burkholderiaceae TaxID=119060 RepID=UPI0012E0BFC6|nr:hypothetical protein [Burkholderia sp. 9120]
MSLIDKLSERCHEARLAPAKFAFTCHLEEIPLTGDKVRAVDCFHISDFLIQTDYATASKCRRFVSNAAPDFDKQV